RRCAVRTTKSPASSSSVNDSPGATSVSRIVTGSSPGGVMVNAVPTANGPSMVIVSTPAFHSGQLRTSVQRRHSSAGSAPVSTACSYVHIVALLADRLHTDYLCTGYLRQSDFAGSAW